MFSIDPHSNLIATSTVDRCSGHLSRLAVGRSSSGVILNVSIDKAIAKLIESEQTWRAASKLLQTVPGIGEATSATLIAELPRAWPAQSSADRFFGRLGTIQSRQPKASRPTPHTRRKVTCPDHSLHGGIDCLSLQSRHSTIRHEASCRRKTIQSGADCVHAKAIDHHQCHGQVKRDVDAQTRTGTETRSQSSGTFLTLTTNTADSLLPRELTS